MNGGDPVPGPLNPEAVEDIATATALRTLIRGLGDLEKSIAQERGRLRNELKALETRRAEETTADAHMKDVIEGVKHYMDPE